MTRRAAEAGLTPSGMTMPENRMSRARLETELRDANMAVIRQMQENQRLRAVVWDKAYGAGRDDEATSAPMRPNPYKMSIPGETVGDTDG